MHKMGTEPYMPSPGVTDRYTNLDAQELARRALKNARGASRINRMIEGETERTSGNLELARRGRVNSREAARLTVIANEVQRISEEPIFGSMRAKIYARKNAGTQ